MFSRHRLAEEFGNIEAGVSVNAVELVKSIGKFRVVLQQLAQGLDFALVTHLDLFDELCSQTSAPPDDLRIRSSFFNDRLPLTFKQWKKLVGQPVHMIQENELRDLSIMPF